MEYGVSVLIGVVALTLLGCQEQQGKASKVTEEGDRDNVIGWVHGACVASSVKLKEGDEVSIVDINNDQLMSASIGKRNPSSEQCMPLLDDRKKVNLDEGLIFFSLHNAKGELTEFNGLGIAINSSELSGQVIDLNRNNVEDRFAYCSTGEGVSFYVWDKEAGENHPFWKGYYYLGYDTEADCQY